MELKNIRVSKVLQGLVNLTCTMDLVGRFSSLLQQPGELDTHDHDN